jgi:ribosomal protein S18 acetylase RimI-like enzyme
MDVAERVAAAALECERVRAEAIEGGEVVEVADLLVCLSNLPAAELNGVRVLREPADPMASLDAARDVFRARGHGFFGIELEVGRHPGVERAVRDAGLRRVEEWPAMVAEIASLAPGRVPEGADLHLVDDEDDLRLVREVETVVFGTPRGVAERFLGPRMLVDPRIRLFLARLDGRVVGQAAAYLVEGAVGVFGVAVVAPARGRGIGAALTRLAAHAFGDRADLAWLQPSALARPMYERLGFRAVSDWEVWVA